MAATREKIDFTVMYATHDAFRRDLVRLAEAASEGKAGTAEVLAGWANFKHQLHIHHTVEDDYLWPKVCAAVADRPDDLALMEEMEAEHAQLDPVLAAVDSAMVQRSPGLAEKIEDLAEVLGGHMKHEEDAALPLIQEVLTVEDWKGLSRAMGKAQGVKGAAVYVPWITDDVPAADRQKFLNAMPTPIRVMNRLFWESSYEKLNLFKV